MPSFALWGTIVNTVAVFFGALLGLVLRRLLSRLPKKEGAGEDTRPTLSLTIQQGLGLCVVLIGMQGALAANNILVVILSMVFGALLGRLLDLDGKMAALGRMVERRVQAHGGSVAEGFVSATLLFCVGAMTVTGAMEAAMLHQHTTYYAKAMIDMVSAVIFAFSLGYGVLFSAVSVFLIQGTYTLIALLAAGAIPALVTGEMMAVGSLLVVAIGTNLMKVTDIKVMNYLPAMFFPIALVPLMQLFA